MRIAIDHLTRMEKGHICFAGLDDAGHHIRPVLPGAQRLTTTLLARHGGVLDMANLVDLGGTGALPRPPAVEDTIFSPQNLELVEALEPELFWNLLSQNASDSIHAIFGAELKPREKGGWIVPEGQGKASLGGYRPATRPEVYLRRRGTEGKTRIRVRWREGNKLFDLGVTDIRLHGDDHDTPDERLVKGALERIEQGVEILLGVGLTRPFSPDPEKEPAAHWLQVTNLHFKTNPVWRLG